jgi:hypothetical protein
MDGVIQNKFDMHCVGGKFLFSIHTFTMRLLVLRMRKLFTICASQLETMIAHRACEVLVSISIDLTTIIDSVSNYIHMERTGHDYEGTWIIPCS